jgi:hypothetical protein
MDIPTSYLELLRKIKPRAGMYIGMPHISNLYEFLQGWSFGRLPNNVSDNELLMEFRDWVAAKHRITSSHGWASIILFFERDERCAYDRFWELLDEFLTARGLEPLAR